MGGRYQIEVAVETPTDARTAADGRADRIELSSALDLGGLTPTVGLFHEVREAVPLPVWVMIRPRPGDFSYAESDVRVMARDIEAFRPLGPAGFVFGVLRDDGTVDREQCGRLRDLCGGRPCVFHRAFDHCPDPAAALEDLIRLGFVRVLTSGRAPTALAGAPVIAALQKQAAGRIEILPGGRIRAANAVEVVRATGCTQVHASFAGPVPDRPGRSRVSLGDLNATRARLDALAAGS